MALAHINSDPATRSELSLLADQAGIPRAQFLRVLTRRYGPALVEDLTQPARVAPAFEQSASPGKIVTATCLDCEWIDRGFLHEVQPMAKDHHEKTGHRVGPFGFRGVGPGEAAR